MRFVTTYRFGIPPSHIRKWDLYMFSHSCRIAVVRKVDYDTSVITVRHGRFWRIVAWFMRKVRDIEIVGVPSTERDDE